MTIGIVFFIAGLVIGGILAIYVYEPLKRKQRENPLLPYVHGMLMRLDNGLSPVLVELMTWLNCPIETEEQPTGLIRGHTIPRGKENAVVDWLSRPPGGLTITMDRKDIPRKLAAFHKSLGALHDESRAVPLFTEKYPNIPSRISAILDFTTACHQIVHEQTPNGAVILVTYLEILGCNVAQLLRDVRALQKNYDNVEPRYWQPAE